MGSFQSAFCRSLATVEFSGWHKSQFFSSPCLSATQSLLSQFWCRNWMVSSGFDQPDHLGVWKSCVITPYSCVGIHQWFSPILSVSHVFFGTSFYAETAAASYLTQLTSKHRLLQQQPKAHTHTTQVCKSLTCLILFVVSISTKLNLPFSSKVLNVFSRVFPLGIS